MYITLDTKGYTKKPHADEIKKISSRISKNVCEVSDLRTFAEHVSEHGHTWCPAVFNGPRKAANFKSTQLIALDFDGGISFDNIMERCKKYMLPILFAYETFSSIDTDKFRVIFMLDKVITDINIFNIVIDIFMSIFPECDSACKDAARMFFGGKRLIYFNENECTVKAQTLMMNFSLYLKDKHGQRCYKKHAITCGFSISEPNTIKSIWIEERKEQIPSRMICWKWQRSDASGSQIISQIELRNFAASQMA